MFGEDRVERSVVRDVGERDLGRGVTRESHGRSGGTPFGVMVGKPGAFGVAPEVRLVRRAQPVVLEGRRHQAVFGQRQGDAAGIHRDPAPPPLLGDIGGGPAPAGRVENQVAGIAGHEDAALDDLPRRLDGIDRVTLAFRVRPEIRDGYRAAVAPQHHAADGVPGSGKHAGCLREAIQTSVRIETPLAVRAAPPETSLELVVSTPLLVPMLTHDRIVHSAPLPTVAKQAIPLVGREAAGRPMLPLRRTQHTELVRVFRRRSLLG